jgi:cytochrome c nitrite reductase small subunit
MFTGSLLGVGAFTFDYGEGTSYFSTDPRACVNCHIMQPQYDSWTHSSHHAVAGCVDCHLPHEFIPKYIAKADNGFRHSWAFTFQDFHEPIQINRRNSRILQHNCVNCHETVTHEMFVVDPDEAMSCVHCHAGVGHGAAR